MHTCAHTHKHIGSRKQRRNGGGARWGGGFFLWPCDGMRVIKGQLLLLPMSHILVLKPAELNRLCPSARERRGGGGMQCALIKCGHKQTPLTLLLEHHSLQLYFEYSEPPSKSSIPANHMSLESVPCLNTDLRSPLSVPAMPSPVRLKQLPMPTPPPPSLGRAW